MTNPEDQSVTLFSVEPYPHEEGCWGLLRRRDGVWLGLLYRSEQEARDTLRELRKSGLA